MTSTTAHPDLLSPRFWRGFAVTLRPYLMFVSLSAGAVGLALTDLGGIGLLYALAFFFTYGLGQAVTDAFQTDTDGLSAPYRPLVRGDIGCRQVLIVALLGLCLCSAVFVIANPWTAIPAAAAVVGLLTYTWFKRRWWGGPPWNSWIVGTLPLIGVLCGGATPTEALSRTDVLLSTVAVAATYAPFVILGYLKDVSADRATGYDTVVVRFGPRTAILTSLLHALIGLVASFALVASMALDNGNLLAPARLPALCLWGIGWGMMFVAHARLWGDPAEAVAYRGIRLSVSAFVAIHLGEVALLRPALSVPVVLAFGLSLWLLARRPMQAQI